ncbi:MAG: hypothetical protein AAB800_04010 [Patescibacteria group bacterium]
MKKSIFLFLVFLFVFPQTVGALYDPTSVPNNKYGILIVDISDIPELPALLNSTGGDWGYVTLVIPDNDRDHTKWQKIFDQLRRLHLIPIVRLATHVQGSSWAKPNENDVREWVQFLSKLNWPVENRYIVIFNEPNHAKEWGNTIDPEGYAKMLVAFAKELKASSQDFFILPAGLDASAASDGQSLDELEFLNRMKQAEPGVFDALDGWTSHAYPNPGFSGSPGAVGRRSLRAYQWELGILRSLDFTKKIPVFITETGWLHSQGKYTNTKLLSSESVGDNIRYAAVSVWNDPIIAAVTPFIFNYQDTLFDHFSWRQFGSDSYYPHYYAYQGIPKTKGTPRQRQSYETESTLFPTTLIADSTYTFSSSIRNTGQGILDVRDGYALEIEDSNQSFAVIVEPLPFLEPGQKGTISFHLKTPKKPGVYPVRAIITHYAQQTTILEKNLEIIPPPSLALHAQLGWRTTSDARDVQVLIYDKDFLIQKIVGLTMTKGQVLVPGLTNIIPGGEYRIVVLVPQYLPRQYIGILGSTLTKISVKRFLPLDVNEDGTFSLADFVALIRSSPKTILSLFFGP